MMSLAGSSPKRYPPISDYALLSDCHSAALVSKDGSIDWCAFHRFDARPAFARVLEWDKGGYFRIAPKARYQVARRYLPGTNVLETRFSTEQGTLVLVDCLVVRSNSGDALIRPHPYHQLLRLVRCEEGDVEILLEFFPRFDYGLTNRAGELALERLPATLILRRTNVADAGPDSASATTPNTPLLGESKQECGSQH